MINYKEGLFACQTFFYRGGMMRTNNWQSKIAIKYLMPMQKVGKLPRKKALPLVRTRVGTKLISL